jgi:VCBS repeat protein
MVRFAVILPSWRLAGLLAASLWLCTSASGCWWGASSPPVGVKPKAQPEPKVDLERLHPAVAAFCGDCHAIPPASSFAKSDWPQEVQQGYEFYWNSGRTDLVEPVMSEVVAYFKAQASDELVYPPPGYSDHPLPVRLRRQDLSLPEDKPSAGVSSIVWQAAAGLAPGRLLFTDMRHGDVCAVTMGSQLGAQRLARLVNPASIEVSDLDGDGRTDYLLSELGSFPPKDHDRGQLVWLRADGLRGWESHVLLGGVGRVAKAVAGDFDGDKDVDVLVAEFGWRRTGKIHLLRRSGDNAGLPNFEDEIIDKRHGVSHLVPLDWDADGDLDFVALITQEHEKVELFLNDGGGAFRIETIFAAGNPAFGSSGIELDDLDGDGDLDVLYTNGDSLDSMTPKPYHAVRWLENRGGFPFAEHLISAMPGVYKAVAADFDGDGDLDIAAMAFPKQGAALRSEEPPIAGTEFDLLVILEQTEPGRFVRHRLEAPGEGLALAAADFDGDGDIDLASGNFTQAVQKVWLTIWWNDGPASKTPAAAGDAAKSDRVSGSGSN